MSEASNKPHAEPDVIQDMLGRPIRKIKPSRMLRSGDTILNMHGQALWEVLAFHPQGVRVVKWPEGAESDWSWESVYSFYERVQDSEAKTK